jgi:hypothetical protein
VPHYPVYIQPLHLASWITPASYPNSLLVPCLILRQVAIYGRVHIYQCFIVLLHQLHRAVCTPHLASPHTIDRTGRTNFITLLLNPAHQNPTCPSLLPSTLLSIAFLAYGIALTARSCEIRPVGSGQPDSRERNGLLLCTIQRRRIGFCASGFASS